VPIQVEESLFFKFRSRLGKKKISLVKLTGFPDEEKYALLKEIQWHPYRNQVLHLDFYGVDLDEEIVVEVPLQFEGTPKGVIEGGILEILHRTLSIRLPARDLVEEIKVPISSLPIGAVLHAGEVVLPPSARLATDPGFPLLHIVLPKVEKEEKQEEEKKPSQELSSPSPVKTEEDKKKS